MLFQPDLLESFQDHYIWSFHLKIESNVPNKRFSEFKRRIVKDNKALCLHYVRVEVSIDVFYFVDLTTGVSHMVL